MIRPDGSSKRCMATMEIQIPNEAGQLESGQALVKPGSL